MASDSRSTGSLTPDSCNNPCFVGNALRAWVNPTTDAVTFRLPADINAVQQDRWRAPPTQSVRCVRIENVDLLVILDAAIRQSSLQTGPCCVRQWAALKRNKLYAHIIHIKR